MMAAIGVLLRVTLQSFGNYQCALLTVSICISDFIRSIKRFNILDMDPIFL